ncbi:hypothetical protein F2Q69_00030108 [Brassica cretica]|uniref:Uncharacterized protein n=1 Tax=Brassica cretica TaxID=69181 RepID=A0A8S9S2T3_BRACR|nr:hypothetical protein F2Q69_00030108 [Brassica cretica]
MSLLGIGVPHGVPGDIWVHLELKGERPHVIARGCGAETPKSSILERPLRALYQGRSQPERPAQSDYLKSLQPERPAQVARVLTGRDTKKRVGSDLLKRLC